MEIAVKDAHFPVISLENNSMTGGLTSHFLTVHRASRICFLGCSTESYISDVRESYYRDALKKHGKTPAENDIYHCSYDSGDVNRALDFSAVPERQRPWSATMTGSPSCSSLPPLRQDTACRKTSL